MNTDEFPSDMPSPWKEFLARKFRNLIPQGVALQPASRLLADIKEGQLVYYKAAIPPVITTPGIYIYTRQSGYILVKEII